MKRTLFTAVSTALTTTAAYADPGHIEAAGHGHSHILAYVITAGVAAVAAGIWIARATRKTTNA